MAADTEKYCGDEAPDSNSRCHEVGEIGGGRGGINYNTLININNIIRNGWNTF